MKQTISRDAQERTAQGNVAGVTLAGERYHRLMVGLFASLVLLDHPSVRKRST